jgi:hypothetical protein
MWTEPTDRDTIRALCDWFDGELTAAAREKPDQILTLPHPLVTSDGQFLISPRLSRYLQDRMNMSQNSVRRRLDRVMGLLEEWGFVEVSKDE